MPKKSTEEKQREREERKQRMRAKKGKSGDDDDAQQQEHDGQEAQAPTGYSTDALSEREREMKQANESGRNVAGVRTSHDASRDVHVDQLTLLFKGTPFLEDAGLELNWGRRYGLIGQNGSGKSTLLAAIASKEPPFDVPSHLDVFFLTREVPASDVTALQAVMSVDEKRQELQQEAERIMEQDPSDERLADIYERLDELDSDKAEANAASLLFGLGFDAQSQQKRTADFSGGWRMRISLARALYMQPSVLLLDEPTNHLDASACVWLEDKLSNFNGILVIISHSMDFLNGVCTNMIYLFDKKLRQYTGNYDTFLQRLKEEEDEQWRKYNKEQEEIEHLQDYIRRNGAGNAKLARQAQSKEKQIEKMKQEGLTEKPKREAGVSFKFADVDVNLPQPVLSFQNVTFGYSRDKILLRNVDFGVDFNTSIAIVGNNGSGKSTLLKLLLGEENPIEGSSKRHPNLKIGKFSQHTLEALPLDKTPVEYISEEFNQSYEKARSSVGRFGLTGKTQVLPIKFLSDGLRSRVCFAHLSLKQPSMLVLDEPTNALDPVSIDALADALQKFQGAVVLVSHDFRLISKVSKEIWEVRDGQVHRWEGTIEEYKEKLRKNMTKHLADNLQQYR